MLGTVSFIDCHVFAGLVAALKGIKVRLSRSVCVSRQSHTHSELPSRFTPSAYMFVFIFVCVCVHLLPFKSNFRLSILCGSVGLALKFRSLINHL